MTNENSLQLPPSGIGEAAKHNFDPWFIKIRFQDKSPLKNRNWKDATKTLSIIQSTIGNEFEKNVYAELNKHVNKNVNNWFEWGSEKNKNKIIKNVERVANQLPSNSPTILTQARLSGKIKLFEIMGDSDLIILFPTSDGVFINVIDIKSSWDEKPYQQLQTATYTLLLDKLLSGTNINYEIGGGIIYRETDLEKVLSKNKTPTFHLETREGDVKRILSSEGPFRNAFKTDYEELPLSINESSPYAEINITDAIESNDLSLLGISPSEKYKLKEYGIKTIEDIAELYKLNTDSKPYKYNDYEINYRYKDKINKINENISFSDQLPIISHRAQALLGKFKPDSDFAHDKPWNSWLKGVGSAEIPEDNPNYDTNLPFKENSMIRVYLNVQYDYVRDSLLAISGRITSGLYNSNPLSFSRVVNDINRNADSWQGKNEKKLLQNSLQDIFKTINMLGSLTSQKESPIHIYLYSQDEYDKFYECVKRHQNDIKEAKSMRRLLDKREGIDQPIFSIIEPIIKNKFALKQIDTSIYSIMNNMYPQDAYAQFSENNWMIKHSGKKINLKDAFKQNLFDSYVPISYNKKDLAAVLNENNNSYSADDFFALLPRKGAQIPIEYLWASEDIDLLNTDWTDNENKKRIIRNYMWIDTNTKEVRIDSSMYKLLSNKFAHMLHHIERAMNYRDSNITKKPIDLSSISESGIDRRTLAESCRDYLDLESIQTKKDVYEIYKEPVKKRIIDGESIPIEITDILEDEGYMFKAKGKLLYDKFEFDNPGELASSARMGEGSRCVMTPLSKDKDNLVVENSKPYQISKNVKVSISNYNPINNNIIVQGFRTSSKLDFEYVTKRQGWSLDSNNSYGTYVGNGEMFVLDPNPDNTMAEKSIKSLKHADSNPLYNDITNMKNKNIKKIESKFSKDNLRKYINWSEKALDFTPNEKQKEFILKSNRYSLLQGPPGTGKTSGALAHAILARLYNGQDLDKRITGLVTGLSNKSINEVMIDVVELLERYDSTFDTHKLENTRIVRLSYDKPNNISDKIEYLNYNESTDIEILNNLIMDVGKSHQQTLNSSNNNYEHLVVFATPGKIDGLIGKLFEGSTAEDGYKRAYDFFDLLAIDEASMMPMYQLIMSSAFIKEDSQVMLAGDQRQLSPVQKYEWKDEKRTSIVENLPHLSALDYFRYLRGDDVDNIYDDSPKSPEVNIPITKLNETYRCHKVVTEFLRRTVYKQDDINYTSNVVNTLPSINANTKGLNTVLDSDAPLTVIIHDDDTSKQVNLVEATMLSALTKEIPESESIGIVTPHNAQKGKLKTLCQNSSVDTVERFQGGEKDIMFLSTTVSEPTHLSNEEEFILSLNRLNVALSRMKKKLVVLVPESIFNLVPDDIDTYDEAKIWKALYAISAANNEPNWTGNVSQLLSSDMMIPGSKTNLNVYNIKNL